MNETYRDPSKTERAVIERLLENFPGRSALTEQLDDIKVRKIDEEGSLSLKVAPLAASAEVKETIVAEAYYSDEDPSSSEGPQIRVLLHVVNGRLAKLEIYKDDGSPIKRLPLAERLVFY